MALDKPCNKNIYWRVKKFLIKSCVGRYSIHIYTPHYLVIFLNVLTFNIIFIIVIFQFRLMTIFRYNNLKLLFLIDTKSYLQVNKEYIKFFLVITVYSKHTTPMVMPLNYKSQYNIYSILTV